MIPSPSQKPLRPVEAAAHCQKCEYRGTVRVLWPVGESLTNAAKYHQLDTRGRCVNDCEYHVQLVSEVSK